VNEIMETVKRTDAQDRPTQALPAGGGVVPADVIFQEPITYYSPDGHSRLPGYSREQRDEYALAAVAADRITEATREGMMLGVDAPWFRDLLGMVLAANGTGSAEALEQAIANLVVGLNIWGFKRPGAADAREAAFQMANEFFCERLAIARKHMTPEQIKAYEAEWIKYVETAPLETFMNEELAKRLINAS
jgi:hypothetical protein